ncbi:hypothetical protein [uncultured Jatrophihabitans sp.]|uniref:hypothetical protein n=1 Tax=uncultured Jatrophihabitans sp. TaxID=1610747 RepID=UPI0035CB26DA
MISERFKLFGLNVEAKSLDRAEEAEHSRFMNLNDEVLVQVQRLQRPGRVQYGGFGELIDDGWNVEDIASVVDS